MALQRVRGKFNVESITRVYWNRDTRVVKFNPVYGGTPEDDAYHTATPSGSVELTIDNPVAAEFFELGKSYYLDFTPAE